MISVALGVLYYHVVGDLGIGDVCKQVLQRRTAAGNDLVHAVVGVVKIVYVVVGLKLLTGVIVELEPAVVAFLYGYVEHRVFNVSAGGLAAGEHAAVRGGDIDPGDAADVGLVGHGGAVAAEYAHVAVSVGGVAIAVGDSVGSNHIVVVGVEHIAHGEVNVVPIGCHGSDAAVFCKLYAQLGLCRSQQVCELYAGPGLGSEVPVDLCGIFAGKGLIGTLAVYLVPSEVNGLCTHINGKYHCRGGGGIDFLRACLCKRSN